MSANRSPYGKSLKDEIIDLASSGKTSHEIARLTGSSRKNIQNRISDYQSDGLIPLLKVSDLPGASRAALAQAAKARGISRAKLAARIINVVLADDLIRAVLDDEEDRAT